jgi:hypothetical protein
MHSAYARFSLLDAELMNILDEKVRASSEFIGLWCCVLA